MPMYSLIEYSDNYSDTSGSLWQFKRDKIATNANICNVNSSSFRYKASLIGNVAADGANGKKEKVKIAVPLKYLSNFWRSLLMLLINCKVELSLTWIEIVYYLVEKIQIMQELLQMQEQQQLSK